MTTATIKNQTRTKKYKTLRLIKDIRELCLFLSQYSNAIKRPDIFEKSFFWNVKELERVVNELSNHLFPGLADNAEERDLIE